MEAVFHVLGLAFVAAYALGPFFFAIGWILSSLRRWRVLEVVDALTWGMQGDIVTRVATLKYERDDLAKKVASLEAQIAQVTDIPY